MATMKPTPEQIEGWLSETAFDPVKIARLAYAAGAADAAEKARKAADAELEACCEWMEVQERLPGYLANDLRKARRPKPLSLKQQAEEELQSLQQEINKAKLGLSILHGSIGRAIESLPDA
jgi:hypothetical protein